MRGFRSEAQNQIGDSAYDSEKSDEELKEGTIEMIARHRTG